MQRSPSSPGSGRDQIINSESVPGADVNSGIVNPIRAFAQVIGEPRLDDASATAWYMAAKKGSDTIEVAYLDGVDTPYLEQQEGFTVDGVASKVRTLLATPSTVKPSCCSRYGVSTPSR